MRVRNRTWGSKFADAFRGLFRAIRTQSSFRVHLVAATAVVGLAALLGVSAAEWGLLGLAITSVLAAEVFNSALESLARALGPGYHPRIRDALDMSSAAVLVVASGAVVVGAAVFGPRIVTLVWTRW